MDNKKTIMVAIGVLCGIMFVYGLDIMTARWPAELRYHFLQGKVIRYDVQAGIDNLTLLQKGGRRVPVRYTYTEHMQLNFYFYHAPRTGRRTMVMELLSKKIVPEQITVDGKDRTASLATGFAKRTPPPWYLFFTFEEAGVRAGLCHASRVRDMIVSTYYVRTLPKGTARTRDRWSGEIDMGPFITTYNWRFDKLRLEENNLADVSGGGEFFQELPGGGKGASLGSYAFSYTLGTGREQGYVREAKGSFDIISKEVGERISYREEFVQKLAGVDKLPNKRIRRTAQELEDLRQAVAREEEGDAQAFHDSLLAHLLKHRDSLLWDNLFTLLNDLRAKCGFEPVKREELEDAAGPGKAPEEKKKSRKKSAKSVR